MDEFGDEVYNVYNIVQDDAGKKNINTKIKTKNITNSSIMTTNTTTPATYTNKTKQ